MRGAKALFVAGLVLATSALWLASCGPAGFQDEALVNGVRILATRADVLGDGGILEDGGGGAYAKPGDTVLLSVLAADGRTSKPEPMVI